MYNFVTGVLGGLINTEGDLYPGWCYNRTTKAFENKLQSSADQNTFEFTHFFKLHQNVVKNRIHFNTSLKEAFIQGLVTGCIFCFQVDRLRAVSYFSLQSYCTRNLSTQAAKPRAARNESVSPRRNLVSVRITSWFAIALDEIRT